MNNKTKILTFMMVTSLVAFSYSDENDLQTKIEKLTDKTQSQVYGHINHESYKLLQNSPYKHSAIKPEVVIDVENLTQGICIGTETNKMIHFENPALEDFQYGLENCEHLSKRVSNREISYPELFDRTQLLVSDYAETVNKLQYPADIQHHRDFYDLFLDNLELLKASRGTPLYPVVAYIMGDSAIKSGDNDLYMVGPTILVNLILESENRSIFSQYAWVRLNDEIKYGFTGSSGDHTPKEWKNLLNQLTKLII